MCVAQRDLVSDWVSRCCCMRNNICGVKVSIQCPITKSKDIILMSQLFDGIPSKFLNLSSLGWAMYQTGDLKRNMGFPGSNAGNEVGSAFLSESVQNHFPGV